MENLVTITVDGEKLHIPKGELLWEACQAHGIEIPIFCYHTKLGPVGACRTCLVEVEGMTKGPITACSTPVTDGMVVRTRSPMAEKAQRGIFEFLLANHPLDCPICDRAGECPLQDQTFAFGPGTSRYIEPKRHHVKPITLGPTIALDRERCVLCWRCVRFCAEVAEDKSIILQDRGDHTVVGTFQNEAYVSNFSGNVIELCPVGALTSRKQRFNFRPWELHNLPSICPHCAMGCNINVSVRKNDEVIRFLSRDNPGVDDSWLCDRGRFGFEFINSPERLASPLIRRGSAYEEVSWFEALEFIVGRLTPILEGFGPEAVCGIASPRLTNEDLFTFKRFMVDSLGSRQLDHFPRPQTGLTMAENDAMVALSQAVMPIAGLDDSTAILILGADPSRREPVMELRVRLAVNRQGTKLVVANDELIALSAKAGAILTYESGDLAGVARSLAAALRGEAADDQASMVAREYLAQGRIAILYDDTFEGVTEKGDALMAVAELVRALATRGEVGIIPMLDDCNSMGARDLGILPESPFGGSWGPSLVDQLLQQDSSVRAAFILGSNIARDSPESVSRLRNLDLLIVTELMMTETARLADVILPAASFAEKTGTFTNTERRIQRVSECVPSPGVARPDWQILVDLSQYFSTSLEYSLPEDIWDEIRHAVPAYRSISYAEIGSQGILASAREPVAGRLVSGSGGSV